MNEILKQDLHDLDILLESIKNEGLAFLSNLHTKPTSVKSVALTQTPLLEHGTGTRQALTLFKEKFESLMVASAGPRYWGFVTGGTTPAALAGDWLTSIYDQNPQGTQGQGDLSAVIENETIALLLALFDLPGDFLGGFVTGATLSNFTCLSVARQWLGNAAGKDIAKAGVSGTLPVLTATPHSSAIKSLAMCGLGSSNFTKIKTLPGNREALDVEDLEEKIIELHGQPFILISSGGTVNTVDFDDFQAIARLREKYSFWWHIDAAFGAFAACSPAHKYLLKGWETADSLTIDCHKWLNVPYDSAIFLVKEKYKLLQTETFQNSNAPYLGDPLENFSYLNFLPENSRRLRALPVWFSLVAYGKAGFQDIVENCIALAQQLGSFVEQSADFELLAPVRLNTVCFTLRDREDDIHTFLTRLNDTGRVFMTPTVYKGRKGIRAAFVNWRTQPADVQLAIDLMQAQLAPTLHPFTQTINTH